MNKETKWEFASTGGSPDDGIHNSMIEHFAGNYNYHLAREIIQNSLDAKLKSSKDPVLVEFKLEFFDKNEFPGHKELNEVFEKCLEYWADSDTQDFITKAKKCLTQNQIPFLKISDYNTKGLSGGDFDKEGTWYKLVKSRGSSSKNEGEGGSFGIGKGAPFAASNLRVVFYSTKNEAGFSIFQGIGELVSFQDNNNDIKRGIGSYGKGQLCLKDPKQFPSERFWRKTTGTDIYIAGYQNNEGWKADLTKSVLRNFWYAIFKNELKVKIESEEINSLNLEEFLTRNFSGERLKDDIEPVGNPLQYYLTVIKGHHYSETIKDLGEVSFYFLDTEEYLNHVAMMRKSHMVIYSRTFRFPGNFAGVFICDDENGNRELRKMEPPAHDKWIVNRNPEKGTAIFDNLSSFIRECLEKSRQISKSSILDIPDMQKYLPDNEDGETGDGEGEMDYSGNEGAVETSMRIQKREIYAMPAQINPFKVAVLNRKIGPLDDPDEPVLPPEPGLKRRRKKKRSAKENIDVRVYNSKVLKEQYEYTVVLKGKRKAKYDLFFFSVGEDVLEKLDIVSVSDIGKSKAIFKGNYIRDLWLEKDEVTRFSIVVNAKFKNALKLEINEIQ